MTYTILFLAFHLFILLISLAILVFVLCKQTTQLFISLMITDTEF